MNVSCIFVPFVTTYSRPSLSRTVFSDVNFDLFLTIGVVSIVLNSVFDLFSVSHISFQMEGVAKSSRAHSDGKTIATGALRFDSYLSTPDFAPARL